VKLNVDSSVVIHVLCRPGYGRPLGGALVSYAYPKNVGS
ncbi:hypothetical protein A2U01_0115565, partial [Trifolium medium]|nr:hypothetical protein [Trifolium medium]